MRVGGGGEEGRAERESDWAGGDMEQHLQEHPARAGGGAGAAVSDGGADGHAQWHVPRRALAEQRMVEVCEQREI